MEPEVQSIENEEKMFQSAGLLTHLAALLGEAVPAHRFNISQTTDKGIALHLLPLADQLRCMWMSRFPAGKVSEVLHSKLHDRDFPLLWVSDAEEKCVLLLGSLANGSYLIHGESEAEKPMDAEGVALGSIFKMLPNPVAKQKSGASPKSAKDWFRFAIRKHWHVFGQGIFATFIISLLALFTSLYTMQVYDRVVPTRGFSTLFVLTVGVVMAILLEFMMKQSRAYIVERAAKKIDIELADVFFNKALTIRMDARPATVGTFASQIRNFESVRNFMTTSTLFILADAPFALFFLVVIALLAGPVALVPALMIPLAVLTGWLLSRKIKHYTELHMEESNKKNGLLIEAIDGIEAIKAAGASWKQRDKHNELTTVMAENDIKMRQLNTRATNISQSLQQFNYVGLIAAGAFAITAGNLTMGGLIACSILVGRALTPISQIPNLINQWSNAKVSLEALDGIMALPNDRDDDVRLVVPSSCKGDIRFEGVGYGYSEDKAVLDIESLSIKAGERVAIIGAVGSGKSTLIKLMSGLYRPKKGAVFLDGVDMSHLAEDFISEHVGYLPQDVRLFNGSLRDNLILGLPTPADSRIMRAAALTGLDKVISSHPKGFELPISEGGRGLSGGQRQLVGLTRMLLAAPRILMLDEPTASMDTKLEVKVMKHLFEEMPAHSSVIVVTHKPAVLTQVDRIIVMGEGRVLMDDKRDKVLSVMRQPAKKSAPSGA